MLQQQCRGKCTNTYFSQQQTGTVTNKHWTHTNTCTCTNTCYSNILDVNIQTHVTAILQRKCTKTCHSNIVEENLQTHITAILQKYMYNNILLSTYIHRQMENPYIRCKGVSLTLKMVQDKNCKIQLTYSSVDYSILDHRRPKNPKYHLNIWRLL